MRAVRNLPGSEFDMRTGRPFQAAIQAGTLEAFSSWDQRSGMAMISLRKSEPR
jgi:hypothetical protein